jgi:hypothetical protein
MKRLNFISTGLTAAIYVALFPLVFLALVLRAAFVWLFFDRSLNSGDVIFAATLGATALTLADWAKRLDPDGKVPTIVELLSQTNEILLDMRWIEGNLPTGTSHDGPHRTADRRLALAEPGRHAEQVDDRADRRAVRHARGVERSRQVDLAMLNGNVAAFRLSEARAFLEAMNQEMAQTLFYGNAASRPRSSPACPRATRRSAARQRVERPHAGGSGSDNSSIWLVAGARTPSRHLPEGLESRPAARGLRRADVKSPTGIGGSRRCARIRSGGSGRPASR